MKKTIKLSDKAIEAVELIKEIDDRIDRFEELMEDAQELERYLVGTVICGIHSPLVNYISVFLSGPESYIDFMLKKMNEINSSKKKQTVTLEDVFKELENK